MSGSRLLSTVFTIMVLSCLSGASMGAFAQGPGSALVFDGVDEYVDIANNAAFELTEGFTVEAWVKPDSITGNARILSKRGGPGGYGFGRTDGKLRFTTFGVLDYDTSGAYLSVGSWLHVAVVFDTMFDASFYVNGVLEETIVGVDPAAVNSSDVNIGRNPTDGAYWAGQIDEVRIWNVERTAIEIQDNMCQKLTGVEAGLVAYWRLDDGAGLSAVDSSSNGHSGTLVNMEAPGDWVASGAAIGDVSTNEYLAPASLNLTHSDGDDLTVTMTAGSPSGIQIYRIDEAPNDTTPPAGFYKLDPLRYWGVFIAGGGTYTLTYNYDGHPGVLDENSLRLAVRADASSSPWGDLGATLDTLANTLTKTGETGTEYTLGSTSDPLPVELTRFEIRDE